jgi:hypothetical protein
LITTVSVAVSSGINIVTLLADKALSATIDHPTLFAASHAGGISSAVGETLCAGPIIAAPDLS